MYRLLYNLNFSMAVFVTSFHRISLNRFSIRHSTTTWMSERCAPCVMIVGIVALGDRWGTLSDVISNSCSAVTPGVSLVTDNTRNNNTSIYIATTPEWLHSYRHTQTHSHYSMHGMFGGLLDNLYRQTDCNKNKLQTRPSAVY